MGHGGQTTTVFERNLAQCATMEPMSRRSQKGLAVNDTRDRRSMAERKRDVLGGVMEYGTLAGACREHNVPIATAETWQERDDEFAELLQEARKLFLARLEAEALRRAVEGVTEGIYYQGERIDSVRKYSDGLLTFLMKANDPEKYRDTKVQLEIVTVDAIDKEIERLKKELEARDRSNASG